MASPSRTRFFTSCVAAFQGGGCRAAALVGAVTEAASRGVSFVEYAGTSAGSIIAVLMGAGARGDELAKIVREIDFKKLFFRAPEDLGDSSPSFSLGPKFLLAAAGWTRFSSYRPYLTHLGLHSSAEIDKWIDERLRELLGLDRRVRFEDLIYPTWVVSTDISNRNPQVWSKERTPTEEVGTAVRKSCTIPGFFQPVASRYVDGGVLSNLPAFVYAKGYRGSVPLSGRILGFALTASEEGSAVPQSAVALARGLVETVVDGASELQLRTQPNVHVISIPTGTIRATDVDKMNDESVTQLIESGRRAARQFFDEELVRFRATESFDPLCHDYPEMYAAVVENLDNDVKEVLVSYRDASWIYKLFPAFLIWRMRGASIRVLLPPAAQTDREEQYKRRLLRAMGIVVSEVTNVTCEAFIFDGSETMRASAVVGISGPEERKRAFAIKYSAPYDSSAIGALYESLSKQMTISSGMQSEPNIVEVDPTGLLERLKRVRQYSAREVTLRVEDVPLDSLMALRLHVNDYKYRQVDALTSLYRAKGLALYASAEVILDKGRRTIAVPPVVEKSGSKYVLVEGTARAVFSYQHRQEVAPDGLLKCIVADGVREQLPAKAIDLRYALPASRDPGISVEYKFFRHIEHEAHPLDSLE